MSADRLRREKAVLSEKKYISAATKSYLPTASQIWATPFEWSRQLAMLGLA
jgi:hypothetical protein